MNMAEFLSMDGYGVYVWPSYALFVLALAWDALSPVLRRRRVLHDLRTRLRREAARRPA